MVPPLSTLSLALCHEALEGGGNQQIRKKKLPQCEIMDPYTGKQLFASLTMQSVTPKAYAIKWRQYLD